MGPRRDLVDQHPPLVQQEQLDRGHAGHVQRRDRRQGDAPGLGLGRLGQAGRDRRRVEPVVAVLAPHDRVDRCLAVGAPGDSHGDLGHERDERLHQEPVIGSEGVPGGVHLAGRPAGRVAVAVVRALELLQHGLPEPGDRVAGVGAGGGEHVVGLREASLGEDALLPPFVADGRQRGHAGAKPHVWDGLQQPVGGRPLALDRHGVAAGGPVAEHGGVGPVGHGDARERPPGARLVVGEDADGDAEAGGGEGRHAAELAAAEDAEDGKRHGHAQG